MRRLAGGVACALALQAIAPSARDIVRMPRALIPAEIVAVLAASRQAIANKTVRLAFPGSTTGPEMLIGANGAPRFTRLSYGIVGGTVSGVVGGAAGGAATDGGTRRTEWHDNFVDIIEHTGQPARRCDGTPLDGELVVTYEHRASTGRWSATAATTPVSFDGRPAPEVGKPIFDLLGGAVALVSEERKPIDGRNARAFVGRFVPADGGGRGGYGSGDPRDAATQTLWVDMDSLLPLRWEVSVGGPGSYVMMFTYAPLDIEPPADVARPTCIP